MLDRRQLSGIETATIRSWFQREYGREITMPDLDRAEAWHLKQHPDWDRWVQPGQGSVPGEASLTSAEWITALRATVGISRRQRRQRRKEGGSS